MDLQPVVPVPRPPPQKQTTKHNNPILSYCVHEVADTRESVGVSSVKFSATFTEAKKNRLFLNKGYFVTFTCN